MKRAIVLTLLLSGCFDFRADLANCRDAGACLPLTPDVTRGTLCTSDGWCWGTPTPHVALEAVVSVDDTTAWAFGDSYTLRFDGTRWIPVPGPQGWVHSAIAFSPSDIFTAGDSGLQRWNGTEWISITAYDSRAVGGVGANDLWISRTEGGDLVHRVNGVDETVTAPLPSATTLVNAFFAVNASSVWAVGEAGLVLHWDGAAWTREAQGLTSAPFFAVWADGDEVWAAGDALLHRSGGTWNTVPHTVPSFSGIAGTSNELWFAGYGGGWQHWSNGAMSSGTMAGFAYVYALGAGPAGLFAVGRAGMIQQRIGGAWRSMPDYGTGDHFYSVHGSAADDVWAVGLLGQTAHFDGQRWTYGTIGDPGAPALSSVFSSSRDVVWVADLSGQLHRRANGTWQVVATLDNASLNAVWASSEFDAWAVGEQNADAVLVHKTPSGTTPYPMPGIGTLRAIAGLSANDIWAVGARGVILHWDGASWATETSGTTAELSAVATSGGEVYAAGPEVLHREGTTWRSLGRPTDNSVNGLAGDGAGGVWFAAPNGVLGKQDLQGPTTQASGARDPMNSIWSPSPGVAFAVGDNGIILQH